VGADDLMGQQPYADVDPFQSVTYLHVESCYYVWLHWSFGVTLWELMTLGQQPYADVDPFEMVTYLLHGYRMCQPQHCPNEL